MKKFKLVISIILILLFLVIFFIRFHNIEADTDVSICHRNDSFITDEGWKSGNAINKYLTGNWICDELNDIFIWPIIPLIQYLSFNYAGFSLTVARMPSLIFSCIIVLMLLWIIIRTTMDWESKIISVILFLFLISTNYYYFIFGRLAFLEIPMIAIGTAALLFFLKGIESQKKWLSWMYILACGILLGISVLTKTNGLIFGLTIFLYAMFNWIIEKRKPKFQLYAVLFSIAVILIIGIPLIIKKNIDPTTSIPTQYIFNSNIFFFKGFLPATVFKNYLRFFTNPLILNNIGLFLFSILSMLIVINEYFETKRISNLNKIFLVFFLSSFLVLGFFIAQATRYFVILLAPMIFFVSTLPVNFRNLINNNFPNQSQILLIRHSSFIIISFILLANVWNMWKLEDYINNYNYSYISAAWDIKKKVTTETSGIDDNIILYGNISSSIALITGLKFSYKIPDKVKSGIYIISDEDLDSNKLKLVSEYNVFSRLYGGKILRLYKKNTEINESYNAEINH